MTPTPNLGAAKPPLLSNKIYDGLKWVSLVVLPATGALYFSLASIWGLPHAGEIVGSITVVDAFLGALLGLSTRSYNRSDSKYDGEIIMDTRNPDKDKLVFQFGEEVSAMAQKDSVTFKVTDPPMNEDLNPHS